MVTCEARKSLLESVLSEVLININFWSIMTGKQDDKVQMKLQGGHHDNSPTQDRHHSLKEKSTSIKRSDHDEKIRYRERQSRSGSGLDPGPSGDHIRRLRGRESSEESQRSRARYREIGRPHDQRKRAQESKHDHREHYHDHKPKRGH
ncbi:hypothetical protein AKJ16_DCAP04171 [Drosera capensis]